MPMTLLQRLPGLQKAPSVRNGLSYLMDGARNLFAVVGDFNVHHKIPLDFFRELHILTVRKLMFPFFEPNLFPLLEGGAAHFLYRRANRTDPLCSAIISALNDLLLVALASNTSISFCLSIPYCPTNGGAVQIPRCPFYPRRAGKNHREKIFAPCLPKYLRSVRILYHARKNCQIVPFAHVT